MIGKFFIRIVASAVDLDPLPVNRVRLKVVEPALFE
jgi:hypothetical protein